MPIKSETPFLTARNPYALAEAVLGRPIDWNAVDDRRRVLEDVLQTPYEHLFDPKHGSPLYLGFVPDGNGGMTPRAPDFPSEPVQHGSDLDRFPERPFDEIRVLADLARVLGIESLDAIPVRNVAMARAGGLTVELGESPRARLAALGLTFNEDVRRRLINFDRLIQGWTPPGASWVDNGTFFKEGAEYFDPIQGGLADCWLIAAMASVAWALPYTLAQRSRATGGANEQFTNLFEFVDPATGVKHSFEATDQTLVWSGTTWPLYGRSSEPGEIWPALVEKSYAMWRGGTTEDRPDLTVLNGGDPVHASAALTGRKPQYTWTAGSTTAQLTSLVKANSRSYRTVNPMTAWTYGSGDDSPDKVNYDDANIVAGHAYSVLGWTTGSALLRAIAEPIRLKAMTNGLPYVNLPTQLNRLQRDYIVLRNPWGDTEATRGDLGGAISMRDVSFWRTIALGDVDGVFAIDFPTFKRYFAGIGVAV